MILDKGSLKFKMLQALAYMGDGGIEFLLNQVAKGGKVYLGRKYYKSTYFQNTLEQLTTTRNIQRVTKGTIPYLRLAPDINSKLRRHISFIDLQKKKWQGYFIVISYDFPEKLTLQRRALRKQIKSWGMGKFQRSLWITAHSLKQIIDDFLKANRLNRYAYRLKTKKLNIAEGQKLAEKVWKLEKLGNNYFDFLLEMQNNLEQENFHKKNFTSIYNRYLLLLEKDPFLPYDLLPRSWAAPKVRKTFLHYLKLITKQHKKKK